MNRMKISRLAGAVLLSSCLWAKAEVTDEVQLEISAEATANMRDGTRGVNAYLAPVGPLESRVRAGRVTLTHALDDTGAVLTQATTNKFYSVSVGRIDDSKDLTSGEPTPFSVWGLSKGAKALMMISGTLELVIPDLDSGSTVVVEHIDARYGTAIASGALDKAGVTLIVFDKKTAYTVAAAKTHGGPQDYDAGPMFGQSLFKPPPGFPKVEMEEGDIAVAIDDPEERLVGLEIQAADGSPLRYNHGGNYHSSGLQGSPGKRFDTYHLGTSLPDNARLVCWLITPGSLLKVPFHLDTLPLPDAGGGRHKLGLITVQLDGAILKTKEALRYQEALGDSKVESTTPQVVDKIVQLWSDVPEYVAILKRDMHYKRLPKLLSSVAPEQPPGPPLPPNTTVTVLVSFAVDDRGSVEAARVVESNDARFNITSVEAVLRWKFQPAEVEDGPAVAFITIPFVFNAPKPMRPAPVPPASG
jgi:TonB family protein